MSAVLKLPPHSTDSEQSVLGGLMIRPEAAVAVFGAVAPDDFYRADHKVIAGAIRRLHDQRKPHDFIAVTEALRDSGRLNDAGGAEYIVNLAMDCAGVANIENWARILRDKALRRRVIALCAQTSEAAYRSEADDLTGMLATGVETLLKSSGSVSRKFADLLGPTEAYLKMARERRKAGGTIGVPSGLPALDQILSGFWGGRVYGIAARPGTGKTALLNQIAFHAAQRGEPGLIISIEMGAEELIIRALSAHSRKNVGRIFHGYEEETEAATKTAVGMGDLPLWIDTDTCFLNPILASIAAHKHRHGIRWAAIDHVGLIQTEKFNSRNDQIGHITGALKRTAKHLGIPIIALFQLSRMSEKENRRPSLHDLRDSGNIEQDLDVATFLHVDAQMRGQAVKRVHLGILKNRSGRVGWLDDTQFQFDGAVQTFREIAGQAAVPYHDPSGVEL